MNQRPVVLLYPAAALALAVFIYAAGRRLHNLQLELDSQNRRIDDLENYLRPLRDYSKNRRPSL